MPRIRSVKPGYFTSLDIAELEIATRLHFCGLWTYADDEGRGIDDARLIKAAVWPLDESVTTEDVDAMQSELAEKGRLIRYEHGGRRYFQVTKFTDHQKPNRPQESAHPAPEDPGSDVLTEGAVNVHEQLSEGSPPERRGEEGRGGESPSTDVDSEIEDQFEQFWDSWPKRNGKKIGKRDALRKWKRLTLPERRAAYIGAKNYAAASEDPDIAAGAMDAFRWLEKRRWEDWQEPAVPDKPPDERRPRPPEYGTPEWEEQEEQRRREVEARADLGGTA